MLTLFTSYPVLQHIDWRLFARLFERLALLFPGVCVLPRGKPDNGTFRDDLAYALENRRNVSPELRESLTQIEALATPEKQPATDPALDIDPLYPESSRLRNAIYQWLAAHPARPPPAATAPPQPAKPLSSPDPASSPTPVSPPENSAVTGQSKIEIQNSKIPTPQSPGCPVAPSENISPPEPLLEQSKIETQNSKINDLSLALDHLAILAPPEYDRVRRAQAKHLNIRLRTLDAEVEARRCQLADAEADAMFITPIEPWPEPITDAPELFHQAAERFTLQVVLPPGAADTIALFIGHAHAVNAFQLSPRLNLFSIEGGCGKTTTLDILHAMVPRAMRAENLNPPVIFRGVDKHQPTLILDETDTWIMKDPELRGLLNAGHKAGSHAYRCEGPRKSIRAFKAFAPTILAGIRPLPPTLRDRSITIVLAKPADGQTYLRFNPLKADPEQLLARKLARWAQDSFSALKACDPALPPSASNRLADNWRPLFAVAQVIGGDWPARVARAFDLLNSKHNTAADSPSLALLDDIRLVFARTGAPRLFSSQLAHALRSLPGRPWSGTLNGDKPLSQARLARHLATLGIQGQTLRIGDRITRGYLQSSFMQPLTSDSTPEFEI